MLSIVLQTADPREPNPVDLHPLAPVDDREVTPGLHRRHDEVVRIRIILVQEVERALGEHEAEAGGRSGRVLLDEGDVRVVALAAEVIGEVEAGGPGADDQDLQASSVSRPSCGGAFRGLGRRSAPSRGAARLLARDRTRDGQRRRPLRPRSDPGTPADPRAQSIVTRLVRAGPHLLTPWPRRPDGSGTRSPAAPGPCGTGRDRPPRPSRRSSSSRRRRRPRPPRP